jgi:xanthosine utilization system XapX-like protein
MSIDTILGIAGAVLGILGLITGYIFYKKSQRVKEPRYIIKSNNIIKDNITKLSDLNITYKDKKVANLTISKILFWNNGSETIDGSDIANTDPLRVESQNNKKILDAKIIQVSLESNQPKVVLNTAKNIVNISFDYLGKKEGFILQIIHDGTINEDLIFKGIIKGVNIRDLSSKPNFFIIENFLRLIGGVLLIEFISAAILLGIIFALIFVFSQIITNIKYVVTGSLIVVGAVLIIFRRKIVNKQVFLLIKFFNRSPLKNITMFVDNDDQISKSG